jgi:hypothetical protein
MPFGLNGAPRVFTKIMKHVVRTIREIWNIKVVKYLDDILILHQDKSHLFPSRQFQYLGWEWSSEKMDVTLTAERRLKTLDELRRMKRSVHNHKLIPVRKVAKLMGILSAARIQFPLASLHLMKINALKSHELRDYRWNGMIRVNHSIMGELKHWTVLMKKNSPQTLIKAPPPQALLATDAAELGWGAELTLISASSSIQRFPPKSTQQSAQL